MTAPLDRFRYRLLIALIALMLGGHAHWMPPLYVGWLCAVLAVAGWRARHQVRATDALIRLPLLLATLAALIYTVGSPIGREGGSALLGGLIVLKLFESSGRRDARVITAAALFFCMIGFLFGQGLTLTLYFCAVACACFVTLHVVSSSGDGSWLGLQRDLRRGLRVAGRVVAASIPLTVLAFVFFPRLSSPLWGAPWDATHGKTGISDRMRPGALSQLWNDDSPAFRVTFDGEAPPPAARYWRGPVLWAFDGQEWSLADRYRATLPLVPNFEPASVVDYEVLMEPTEQSWWFPLDVVLSAPADSQITGDGQVVSRRPLIGPRRARFQSAWRYQLDIDVVPEQRATALQLPTTGNSRSRTLAQTWRDAHGNDDQAVIDEALALFNREFTYTLEPPPLGNHPVDDFLFNTKAGYCEYFASSFAFLMRAANIPTRIVTGYQGGSYNPSGNYWIVRNSDAHAWTEVWLASRGWVRVAPSCC